MKFTPHRSMLPMQSSWPSFTFCKIRSILCVCTCSLSVIFCQLMLKNCLLRSEIKLYEFLRTISYNNMKYIILEVYCNSIIFFSFLVESWKPVWNCIMITQKTRKRVRGSAPPPCTPPPQKQTNLTQPNSTNSGLN